MYMPNAYTCVISGVSMAMVRGHHVMERIGVKPCGCEWSQKAAAE